MLVLRLYRSKERGIMPKQYGKAIRISDETYDWLQRYAGVPLEDTADVLVRRVLGIAEGKPLLPPRSWLLRNLKVALGNKTVFDSEVTTLAKYMAEVVTAHIVGNWMPQADDDDDAKARRVRRRGKGDQA